MKLCYSKARAHTSKRTWLRGSRRQERSGYQEWFGKKDLRGVREEIVERRWSRIGR